tara:strand:- start:12106 stop:12369 length:264 start_codon:yes stop_codon:yes gene_type:complete
MYYDMMWGGYDDDSPSVKERSSATVSGVAKVINNILDDPKISVYLPSEIEVMQKILKKADDRFRRGIIGRSEVIRDNRENVINEIVE